MFLILLLVTLVIAAITSTIAVFLFSRPVTKMLIKLLAEELAFTWKRYIIFAIYVVGISGGVRVWEMEKYITPDGEGKLLTINSNLWIMEVYKTLIGSLQSIAWMLLVFFLFALIAYVVMKGFESKRSGGTA